MNDKRLKFTGETKAGVTVEGFYFEDDRGRSWIGGFAETLGCGLCFQEDENCHMVKKETVKLMMNEDKL